jgi:uncharacterized membrane protein YqjE
MSAAPSSSSVSHSARRLASSFLALGRIRLELLVIEAQEEKERVARLIFWAIMSALMVAFALVFVALLGTVLFWDSYRLAPLAVASVVFVGLALYGVMRVRQSVAEGASLFKSSLAELRADEAVLGQRGEPS